MLNFDILVNGLIDDIKDSNHEATDCSTSKDKGNLVNVVKNLKKTVKTYDKKIAFN